MNFKLEPLPEPRLSDRILVRAVQELREIATRVDSAGESPVLRNRKEEMRNLLKKLHQSQNKGDFSQVFRQVGWERVLLSLYLDDIDQPWLPSFDKALVVAIIGESGKEIPMARRRILTNLYFKHFDKLEALGFVCRRLQESYRLEDASANQDKKNPWVQFKSIIFDENGPRLIANQVKENEPLDSLLEKLQLPDEGRLVEQVRQAYLLQALRKCEFGNVPACMQEIKDFREELAGPNLRVGSAALQILIERVQSEGQGRWPENWQKWIVELGCDPRLGRSTPEMIKWWGWATDSQLALATRGVIGLSLKLFFEFLDGTVTVEQWRERRLFLEELFDSGKIIDAKLLLYDVCMRRLSRNMRDARTVSYLSSTTANTCVIVLKCVDDVFLIEGTHSFALRAFNRDFPIRDFWDRHFTSISDAQVRIPQYKCPIYIRHHGDWVNTFKYELRSKFHLEWQYNAYRSKQRIGSTPHFTRATHTRVSSTSHHSQLESSLPSIQKETSTDAVIQGYIAAIKINHEGADKAFIKEQVFQLLMRQWKVLFAKRFHFDGREYLVLNCTDNVTLLDASHFLNIRCVMDSNATWYRILNSNQEASYRFFKRAKTDFKINAADINTFRDEICRNLSPYGVNWNLT